MNKMYLFPDHGAAPHFCSGRGTTVYYMRYVVGNILDKNFFEKTLAAKLKKLKELYLEIYYISIYDVKNIATEEMLKKCIK
jgi:hypothetical protein